MRLPSNVAELRALPVVVCEAAKDLAKPPADPAGPSVAAVLLERILSGQSLEADDTGKWTDPIADVMVVARVAVGRFGGALRRIIHTPQHCDRQLVQVAQAVTEQLTQKSLSVKAGEPPVPAPAFEGRLRKLLRHNATASKNEPKGLRAAIAELGEWWGWLAEQMPLADPLPLLDWLRRPHRLADNVRQDGKLVLPLRRDRRLWPFLVTLNVPS